MHIAWPNEIFRCCSHLVAKIVATIFLILEKAHDSIPKQGHPTEFKHLQKMHVFCLRI